MTESDPAMEGLAGQSDLKFLLDFKAFRLTWSAYADMLPSQCFFLQSCVAKGSKLGILRIFVSSVILTWEYIRAKLG